jgi:hypothetical protein
MLTRLQGQSNRNRTVFSASLSVSGSAKHFGPNVLGLQPKPDARSQRFRAGPLPAVGHFSSHLNPGRQSLIQSVTVVTDLPYKRLPARFYALAESPEEKIEPTEHAERFFANTGAKIEYGGNRAFYAITTDSIRMPPFETFAMRNRMRRPWLTN